MSLYSCLTPLKDGKRDEDGGESSQGGLERKDDGEVVGKESVSEGDGKKSTNQKGMDGGALDFVNFCVYCFVLILKR